MKQAASVWQLRWFVVLWVFFGVIFGLGMGWYTSLSLNDTGRDVLGRWFLWIGVIGYFLVAGTLGRAYLRLIRSLR